MFLFSFVTLFPVNHWLVRGFDFPKVQLLVLSFMGLFFGLFFFKFVIVSEWIGIICVSLAILFHCTRIILYSVLHKKEVIKTIPKHTSTCISILVSNVLISNKNYQKLLDRIRTHDPDIFLTLESDTKWEKELLPLEKIYPFNVKISQNNFYGMHLYSKHHLEDIKINHFLKESIPSIEANVKLNENCNINLYALHPEPPSPTEAETSTNRDAELLIVAKRVKELDEPVIVFGDLNDVAWSRSTRLFRKISGLLDPRIGRGRFSTFHAQYNLLRWPLDHLFHSSDFSLNEIKVLPDIGSDHFPIYAKLEINAFAKEIQQENEATSKEKVMADENIEKAFQKTFVKIPI